MAAPKKPTAAAVSRALTAGGLTKSVSSSTRIRGYRVNSRGFHAKSDSGDAVQVFWRSGNHFELNGDLARAQIQLAEAAEILTGKGYAVETVVVGARTHLVVTSSAGA